MLSRIFIYQQRFIKKVESANMSKQQNSVKLDYRYQLSLYYHLITLQQYIHGKKGNGYENWNAYSFPLLLACSFLRFLLFFQERSCRVVLQYNAMHPICICFNECYTSNIAQKMISMCFFFTFSEPVERMYGLCCGTPLVKKNLMP